MAIALTDMFLAWLRIFFSHQMPKSKLAQQCSHRALCETNCDAASRGEAARTAVEVLNLTEIPKIPIYNYIFSDW